MLAHIPALPIAAWFWKATVSQFPNLMIDKIIELNHTVNVGIKFLYMRCFEQYYISFSYYHWDRNHFYSNIFIFTLYLEEIKTLFSFLWLKYILKKVLKMNTCNSPLSQCLPFEMLRINLTVKTFFSFPS